MTTAHPTPAAPATLSRRRIRRPALATALAAVLAAAGPLGAPAASAAPTVPDDLPVFPRTAENPAVTVTTEDGRPVEGATVHRGDVLLVHGTGFDPGANRGGFPAPVPPGTPNGVFVLYGGFPDRWRPSEGAPDGTRTHPHDRMAWVMPAGTLESIPAAPVDRRRSIARQAQPMAADGSFTARITVDPPERTTGGNYGVYVYAGGGSVNAAEEIHVPVAFSPEPGPNTPPPPTPDLVVDASLVHAATRAARGAVTPKGGAGAADGGRVTFSRDRAAEAAAGDGTVRYRGTVVATARFNLVDVALRNPWIEPLPDGTGLVTAEVSTRHDVGVDELHRVPLGTTATLGGLVQRNG